MPEEKINKLNVLGSTINVWGKLLIALFIFVFTVGTAWYQIETNAADNIRQDGQFKTLMENQQMKFEQVMSTMTKEFDIWGQRSDKRYLRAMEKAEDLEKADAKHEEQLLELTKELWCLKGKLEEQDRNR